MSFRLTSWLVIMAAASTAPGDEAWRDCNQKQDFALGIRACTSIINQGREPSSDLSKAYNNRGDFLGIQGEFNRAIADYAKAIELDPENPIPYYNRALTYSKTDDVDRALNDLDHLITMNPTQIVDAYHLRATILFNKHEYDRALPDFDMVVEMAPQNAFALCQRALTLGFLQRFEEAARDISASTRFDPTNKCLLTIQQINKGNKEGGL